MEASPRMGSVVRWWVFLFILPALQCTALHCRSACTGHSLSSEHDTVITEQIERRRRRRTRRTMFGEMGLFALHHQHLMLLIPLPLYILCCNVGLPSYLEYLQQLIKREQKKRSSSPAVFWLYENDPKIF